jgi:hypothetical protein
MTRWHGTTTPIGFEPLANPTARTAAGRPMRLANSPYEIVLPQGIWRNAFHTSR